MNQATTFLERMQSAIDAMPDGQDKDKMQALVELQDTIERRDIHPKQRGLAMRRLRNGAAAQVKERGKHL